jgi:hypothetical protein
MLLKEIIAVYSENHTKHIALLSLKGDGIYIYHWALQGEDPAVDDYFINGTYVD